jgi:transposase
LIGLRPGLKVMLYSQPVDFRGGINSLAHIVATALADDPYSGTVFVFRSRRSDRLKILTWDGSGMVLMTKWLEEGRFKWPAISGGVVCLGAEQMALLLCGLEWSKVQAPTVKTPKILR